MAFFISFSLQCICCSLDPQRVCPNETTQLPARNYSYRSRTIWHHCSAIPTAAAFRSKVTHRVSCSMWSGLYAEWLSGTLIMLHHLAQSLSTLAGGWLGCPWPATPPGRVPSDLIRNYFPVCRDADRYQVLPAAILRGNLLESWSWKVMLLTSICTALRNGWEVLLC